MLDAQRVAFDLVDLESRAGEGRLRRTQLEAEPERVDAHAGGPADLDANDDDPEDPNGPEVAFQPRPL